MKIFLIFLLIIHRSIQIEDINVARETDLQENAEKRGPELDVKVEDRDAEIAENRALGAANCGLTHAGVLIQKVSPVFKESTSLFWDGSKLEFADKMGPAICIIRSNGKFNRTILSDIDIIHGVYPIRNTNKLQANVVGNSFGYFNVTWNKKNTEIENVKYNFLQTIEMTPETFYVDTPGSIDSTGRLWISSLTFNNNSNSNNEFSKIYHIQAAIIPSVIEKQLPASETLKIVAFGFSSNNKNMFVADERYGLIQKWKFNAKSGDLSKYEIVFNITEFDELSGYPCSLTITKEDNLWIGLCRSGKLVEYNWNKKKIVQTIDIPATYPVSMTFGGKNLDVLFVGTSRYRAENPNTEPGAGAVYAISGTKTVGLKVKKMSFSQTYTQTRSMIDEEMEEMAY